jgi:peptide/nickel transport system ATP-binding protein
VSDAAPGVPLLAIDGLTVAYRQAGQWLDAVRDVTFSIQAGETFGLVGESGSGKTTLVLATMRYLGQNGAVRAGAIRLAGRDLLALSPAEMRQVWGRQATMVPQNPQSALNPSLRIGEQIAETLRHHQGASPAVARRRALELLDRVRIADPSRVADSYPHQISGGMQQRVMIAMALSTEPQLLILDEPTTSLDVTTQAVILDLVRDLIRGQQTAALYVTHNLGVVALVCDRVGVLYAGELVEEASTRDLFRQPLHPYTRGLLDSLPRLGETKDQVQLRAIQGQIPHLGQRPAGCVFVPRCPLAIDVCLERPPLYASGPGRRSRCHRWQEIEQGLVSARQPAPAPVTPPAPHDRAGATTLSVSQVETHFPIRRSPVQWLRRQPPRRLRAVAGVSLSVAPGETLGLVGESGSGKTTLARTIMGLVARTRGSVELLGAPLPAELSDRAVETLRRLQMVFQNPEEAFNPNLTLGASLREPLMTLLGQSRQAADGEVSRLLEAVRLPASYAERRPGQLSGGELQRAAIARAFASNPALLIGDEPVSSLDVSVQASILNLLNELQARHQSSLLFISHNLAVVGYLADTVAVIYLGQLMEVAATAHIFAPPYHPYTEALLSAIPLADPEAEQRSIRLAGDIPSPLAVPTGCPFHTRCPRFLGDLCVQQTPPWRVDSQTGKRIFCHIPLDELVALQPRVFSLEPSDHV